ncbi:MAG: oligoendopeptidase [Actinomycetota bacterium]|nr:oligoendopeptidase [Actinomycetota bacterium]
MTATDADMTAADVVWDLAPLLPDPDDQGLNELLDAADARAEDLARTRGHVAELDAGGLASFMNGMAELLDLVGRAGSYAGLDFATDTTDPARGARMQRVEERTTVIQTKLLFFELEWAELPDERVEELLADERLSFARHHLRSERRYRPHLLTEPEEVILTEKSLSGRSAWERLFEEQVATISVELEGGTTTLEAALARLHAPDREVRRTAAEAITTGLEPGLRTRAFVMNTLLSDKAVDDRLRHFDTWIQSRNLANEAGDASVEALVDAVQSRNSIAQRWYALKARLLGIDQLADYDRMASVAEVEAHIGWQSAKELVLDAYGSFSGELADTAQRFFDGAWIDAAARPGKRPGAFCAYTVPSHHPYVLLNWTSRRRDVLTLAHELGHGLHAFLARGQGIFHQSTPLTLAETASVFGETVTFGRLLEEVTDPNERLALLASNLEDQIATVFRQIAMNRFEHSIHTERREAGELSVERLGDLWAASQADMLGDSVEITEGYRTWWSYIPHFIGTPGYVYAYAYGQLLALSVYAQYEARGPEFVPQYLDLLRAGGSMAPEELGKLVDVDLADPGFWDRGLDIIERRLNETIAAAEASGRLS